MAKFNLFYPIHTANLNAIKAMGRSDLFLKLEIVKKGIGLVALVISMQISPLAMAWSLIVTDIIATVINATPNIKLLKYNYLEQLKDMLSPFLLACVMAAVIYPISRLNLSDIYIIMFQMIVGAGTYLLGSVLTKQVAFKYLVGFLKRH